MMIKFSASTILPREQNSIPMGTELTITATPDPSTEEFPVRGDMQRFKTATTPDPSTEEFPDDKPTWDGIASSYLSGTTGTTGPSITISDEAPSGEYIISATCGNTKVMKVVIADVLLESIGGDGKTSTKENAEEIGEDETIYLAQGAQLTLTATPNPSTAEFPDDKPTWTADELFYYFDTATGESITVNGQAPAGEYIISATGGNTKVIKLVIYDLISVTGGGKTSTRGSAPTGSEEWTDAETIYAQPCSVINLSALLAPSSISTGDYEYDSLAELMSWSAIRHRYACQR